jgi:hypothetical protein
MANFADDDHALMTGMLAGLMLKSGIPAVVERDDQGDYVPRIRIRLDVGHARPMDLVVEVKAASPDER